MEVWASAANSVKSLDRKTVAGAIRGQTVKGTGQWLGLVVSHPVTMAGVFVRHLINGLDQRYDTPYVAHLDTGSQRWLRFAGFLLIFLALVRVLWGAARRRLGPARWRYIVVFALCCATSIPSAVETRSPAPRATCTSISITRPRMSASSSAPPSPRRWATSVASAATVRR